MLGLACVRTGALDHVINCSWTDEVSGFPDFRSIVLVRGQPLDLDCRHANLAVTFRRGTAAPIMAERMITNRKLCVHTLAEVVRSHTRVNECVSALRSLGF